MRNQWQPLIKPAFLQDINRLPARDIRQIMEKVTALTSNPHPDGGTKKHLTHCPGKPYRIRSGDYRIFYTYNQHYVHIYKIDRRHESTYKDCPEAEDAPGLDVLQDLQVPDETGSEETSVITVSQPSWEPSFSEPENRPLPEPITIELLNKLQIAEIYHASLLKIRDENAIFECADVDGKVLIQLVEYLFPPSLLQVMQQPDLVLNEVNDLQRYKDRELLTFLLKLSPEQERYVRWPLSANGPTLVKGGPGTGKSTVALYRIQSLLQQFQQRGEDAPRILFTTYTNALMKFSEQLLEQLVGGASSHIHVYTADKVVDDILQHAGQKKAIISQGESMSLLRQAIAETPLEGNMLQQESHTEEDGSRVSASGDHNDYCCEAGEDAGCLFGDGASRA
jgi:mRNA-degrading endonuclease RelE of RelBE toxin-antitoxin system